nr:class I SAM-dependent methyltransferase [Mycobacterium marseillense]
MRSNDDSWDPGTSVGATATMVATARWSASRTENALIQDLFAENLVRAVGVDFFIRWGCGDLTFADLDRNADDPWNTRRLTDYIIARTGYFDSFFLDATAAGIRQAVILASGLDARSYRLAWPAEMVVFEIDQPEVIAFKSATLRAHGALPACEIHTVPIDLRFDWINALLSSGFDATQPTAWIAEGLLNFLPPDAQDRLLTSITGLSSSGSRLAAETLVGPTVADAAGLHILMHHMTSRWREHGFEIEIAELADLRERTDAGCYLASLGWRSSVTTMNHLLAAKGLDAIPEVPAEPSFGRSRFCSATIASHSPLHADLRTA